MLGEKSFIIPHDLPQAGETCDRTCFGLYHQGAILHHGQLMLPAIGGIDWTNRRQNVLLTSNATSFLDFQDKRAKWGSPMPDKRHLHCVVKFNESTVIVFGGGNQINGLEAKFTIPNFIFTNLSLDELRSGFFMG